MWQPTLSAENQHALDEAWAHHRAKLLQEQPRIRPLWFVLGWTFGLPTAVWLITNDSSVATFFWWGVFGYFLISTKYGDWREKALAACYMRASDAFANYVMENDDLEGAPRVARGARRRQATTQNSKCHSRRSRTATTHRIARPVSSQSVTLNHWALTAV